MASKGKCGTCNKTVYSTECCSVGPPGHEVVYHNSGLCFKCSAPDCTWKLTLGNYKYVDGKVWCQPHCPASGSSYGGPARGTANTVESAAVQTDLNAQKLASTTVNEQIRGAQ